MNDRQSCESTEEHDSDPRVSVVVPVYNDYHGLSVTIKSLLDQSASDYEIIIADNNSTDKTRQLADSFSNRNNIKHVIADEKQSSYFARNKGIDAASADIIGFVDADMWVEYDYIDSVASFMNNNDAYYMGCKVDINNHEGVIGRYSAAREFPVENQVNNFCFAPTCCLVVRDELFEAVGTFDSSLVSGGDFEFGNRVADSGFNLYYNQRTSVHHPARNNLIEHIEKRVKYTYGVQQIQDEYPERYPPESTIEEIKEYLPVNPNIFIHRLNRVPDSTYELVLWFTLENIIKISSNYGKFKYYIEKL